MAEFELIAHRGYPGRFPENTLLGFEQAVAAGARYLEADLLLSADRQPLIFHDRDLHRLCGQSGQVFRMQREQLERVSVHAPQQFGRRFLSTPILWLEQLLQLLRSEPQLTLFLELKRTILRVLSAPRSIALVLPLLEELRDQIVLISFSLPLLQAARKAGWDQLGVVLTRWYQINHASVHQLQPDWLFLKHQRIPSGLCCPDIRPRMALYETSDIATARQLSERGFGWIETDMIGEMLQCQRYVEVAF